MVVRKRKRKNKYRGDRVFGAGNKKNRRGSGVRGGVGKAGGHKHKFSSRYMDFGVKIRQKAGEQKGIVLNLDGFERLAEKLLKEKKIVKTPSGIAVDGKELGIAKILSRGEAKEKFILKNIEVSKKAGEKIIASGGRVEKPEGKEESMEEGKKAVEERRAEGKKAVEERKEIGEREKDGGK